MSFRNLEERFNARVNDLYRGYNRKFEDGKASGGINDDPLLTRRPGDSQLGLKQEGRSVPIVSSARDVKRLTLFTLSQRGILFLAKQQLLQTGNTFEAKRLINPAFVIANGVPFLHVRRHLDPPLSSLRNAISAIFRINPPPTDTRYENVKTLGQLQVSTFDSFKTKRIDAKLLDRLLSPITNTISAFSAKNNIGETLGWEFSRPEISANEYVVTRWLEASQPVKFDMGLAAGIGGLAGVGVALAKFAADTNNADRNSTFLHGGKIKTGGRGTGLFLGSRYGPKLVSYSAQRGIFKDYVLSDYTGDQLSGTTEITDTKFRTNLLSEGPRNVGLDVRYETSSFRSRTRVLNAEPFNFESPYGVNTSGAQVSGSDYKRPALNGLNNTTTENNESIRTGLLNDSTQNSSLESKYSSSLQIKSAIVEATGSPYGVSSTGARVSGSDYKRDNLDGLWATADQEPRDGVRSDLLNESNNLLIGENLRDKINSALTEATGSPYGVNETGALVSGSDYKRTKLNGSWITSNQEPESDIRTVLLRDSAKKLSGSYGESDKPSDLVNETNDYQNYVDEEFNQETNGSITSQPFIKYFTPDDNRVILSRDGGTNAAALSRTDVGRKIKYLKDPLNEPYAGVNVLDRYKNLRTLDSGGGESTEDIITVSFAMGNNNHVQFRAFIRDLDQSMSPEYKPYQYIGRIEKFIYYLSVERTVNFKLDILAFSKDELDVVWNRINYMTSLVFPYGVNRGILQPNIVRMTIGNVYVDQPAYITNIGVNFNEVVESWDIDREVPIGATLSLSMNLIEKNTKTANEAFYGINEQTELQNTPATVEPPTQNTPTPDVPARQLPPAETVLRLPTTNPSPFANLAEGNFLGSQTNTPSVRRFGSGVFNP